VVETSDARPTGLTFQDHIGLRMSKRNMFQLQYEALEVNRLELDEATRSRLDLAVNPNIPNG
jgi:hypothetical protein